MEPEEMAKNVDACYKNILEKFNPGARQLINAGKSYLKALHGAAAAAKVYLESLSRVAKQAQQGTCGGTADIGVALQQMIDVQREIQAQQLNTLKAFYVDLLVPLESNIEKDTKVVQMDQKKFNQQYRNQFEVYSKAVGLVKKHGKRSAAKNNRSSASYDKEIKHLQAMDEEKSKLDALCEISLRDAIIQERKRYGFVLERQTSLAKHWLAHYGKGAALLEKHLDGWQETSKARESVPSNVDFLLDSQHIGQTNAIDDNLYALPRTPEMMLSEEADHFSVVSHMRKSHSVDASYLDDDDELHEAVNPKMCALGPNAGHATTGGGINKSKSEFNLAFKCADRANARNEAGGMCAPRPKSMALTSTGSKGTVRALYAYLSSGEHQMSFLEGDLITLLGDESIAFHGDRNKGWNYGENQRTGKRGWFPLAYTEPVKDTDVDSGLGLRSQLDTSYSSGGGNNNATSPAAGSNNNDSESTSSGNSSASNSSSGGGCSTLTLKSRKIPPGGATCTASNTLRPISLIGDRAFFNKVYGFGKLRKSRSAFNERPLYPASTPTLPEAADFPGPATCAPTALPPALNNINNNNNINNSSVPSNSVPSPSKQMPPAPPPRSSCPLAVVPGSDSLPPPPPLVAPPSSDLSLRSNSNDSGFVNGDSATMRSTVAPPPAAPEVDYSDEEALPKLNRLGDWYKNELAKGSENEAATSTMTLDRNPKNASAPESSGDSYPPVLGYLATLTRSKMSQTLKWSDQQQQQRHQRNCGGLFAKNRIVFSPALTTSTKIRTRSTTGILKNALRRSRDSGLDELDSGAPGGPTWQHKSSVPVYVGWRPPMPLPKETATSGRQRAMTSVRIRTNLSRKKSFSESDLLDADSSEYSVIDPVSRLPLLPSLPPTLPFLTPVLERLEDEVKPPLKPHTLPRQKMAPGGLRVQFSLDASAASAASIGSCSRLVEATNQLIAPAATTPVTTFTDYSVQLKKRLQLPEGGSNLDDISETTGNRCGPWYDLWPPIGYPSTNGNEITTSLRFCEIAQL